MPTLTLKKLGGGSYGEVFLVNNSVVAKVFEDDEERVYEKKQYKLVQESKYFVHLENPKLEADDLEEKLPKKSTLYMEYDSNLKPLDQLMKKAEKGWGKPIWEKHFKVFMNAFFQILDGLVFLEEKGLAHNDIKPENILVSPEGNIKMIDLGLVRRYGNDFEVVSPYYRCLKTTHAPHISCNQTDIGALWLIFYEFIMPKDAKCLQEDNELERKKILVSKMDTKILRNNLSLPELQAKGLKTHFGRERRELEVYARLLSNLIKEENLKKRYNVLVEAFLTRGMTPTPDAPSCLQTHLRHALQ